MNTTINISLSKNLYEGAKKLKSQHDYSSVSEVIRDALRQLIYKKRITENGFTEEFEDAVLESAKEPIDHSKVWKTEADVNKYFRQLRKKLYGKNRING